MPWLSLTPILIWAVIMIPLGIGLWFVYPSNKLTLILHWLVYTLGNLVFFMGVNWVLFNYYLRFAPLALSLALGLHWLPPFRNNPWLPKRRPGELALVGVSLLLLAFPIYILLGAYRSTSLKEVKTIPVLAMYPVRTGLYVVGNGGNGLHGWGLNSYTRDWLGFSTERDDEMTFAVDIFEMRTNGSIANHILEADFRKYEIFNELVYSPCMGQVVAVVDGNKDNPPLSPSEGSGDVLGNRIVIQCADFFITLANLRKISVQTGEQVSFNRIVGQVGNSASRSVPHLLMYVTTADGTPVPILFEAGYRFRFVARNHVYVR